MAKDEMDMDAIDVIDEMDIDEDINFHDECTNGPSSINGNFNTRMAAGLFYIPKYIKAPLGEDAHFICIEGETIGVADGIGGWEKKGIDSGEYSRQLIRNAELSIQNQKDQGNIIQPMEVLKEAYFNTKCQGSSTACILTLTRDIVHAFNVGDSGFVVIRDGGIVYKSEIPQKRFNCPFQLGNDDKSDDPSVVQEIIVPVKIGDVIVMASDGLWDNVHDYELEKLVPDGLLDLHGMGTFSKITRMAAGSFYIPKYSKGPLGEDAHFICIEGETIGVADGVGGWTKKGIDSGEYSRQLVRNAELSIHNQKDQGNIIQPMEVLKEAYLNTKCQGSSTTCILTLTCDIVHAVNVGDSGFVVVREGGIAYKSEIQQKRFNCPFQLGNDDKSDDPSVAQEIMILVKTGDVIVMASDGLWDNVHDYELEKLERDRLVDLREMETFSKMLARKIAEYT
ncbi:hypothetical protein HAX54_030893 [Datura stramonium]|uniref:Protein phosphatase n=1 Tax=Datura stramonium TaxID=4076 RepID=A0ABS8V937_DATST|nr:hypothetical protein [Datura stramonium]